VEFVGHHRRIEPELRWVDRLRRRWFEEIGNSFTATMLHPVTITHSQDRNDRNSEEDTRHAGKFFTCQNREYDSQRMKMNALSD